MISIHDYSTITKIQDSYIDTMEMLMIILNHFPLVLWMSLMYPNFLRILK